MISFFVDEDHLALVMADVSGKGIPAAMFMVIAQTLARKTPSGREMRRLGHWKKLTVSFVKRMTRKCLLRYGLEFWNFLLGKCSAPMRDMSTRSIGEKRVFLNC